MDWITELLELQNIFTVRALGIITEEQANEQLQHGAERQRTVHEVLAATERAPHGD